MCPSGKGCCGEVFFCSGVFGLNASKQSRNYIFTGRNRPKRAVHGAIRAFADVLSANSYDSMGLLRIARSNHKITK